MKVKVVPLALIRRRYALMMSSSKACRNSLRSTSVALSQARPRASLPMAGTSNAQASRSRHRSRASASEPEEKKPTEASFTRSTKARIASLGVAVTGVLHAKSAQARATIDRGPAWRGGIVATAPSSAVVVDEGTIPSVGAGIWAPLRPAIVSARLFLNSMSRLGPFGVERLHLAISGRGNRGFRKDRTAVLHPADRAGAGDRSHVSYR